MRNWLSAWLRGSKVPGVFRHVPEIESRTSFLTLEDGPYLETTPAVLQILERHHARATFFLQGTQVARFPELAQEIVRQGHRVACHSFHHQDPWKRPLRETLRDWETCVQLLEQTTGQSADLIRPPFGHVTHLTTQWAARRGMATILWNIHPDHAWRSGWRDAVRHWASRFQPGAIVCLKEKSSGPPTPRLLNETLPLLQAQGWDFDALRAA